MATDELRKLESKKATLLTNFATLGQKCDSLKNESVERVQCNGLVCKGSFMSIPVSRKPGEVRPKEELITQAKEFIDGYYKSIKRFDTPGHHQRWEDIMKEIDSTGTYRLADSELVYGAKLAWRNSPRCIGRIQWAKLQVFDARNVTTASEMFEAMCNHIKYATNKGNIRSAITIFPPRADGNGDFRVWNGQFISYAGYKNADGSFTGDPINVEFTEICIRLGWNPPRTEYDILPLVLQAEGNDPELFIIPKELILEVDIIHPDYPIFKELGLKWYAVPGVSNMSFDCGGLEFPAAPFSGWYMGTEIGARDLCDPQRRNLLEPLARGMNLDVSTNTSLWKDKACIEANYAVLYSFQIKNITIVDHHTASETFMKHLDNEMKVRGGCPGDWVWIVPPISGSLTGVYHQEMVMYRLKPSYEYQIPAWKTHKWKNDVTDMNGMTPKKKHSKHRFREVARAVKFTSNLFGKALSKRVKATILYATETGKSETFARILENVMSYAFNVQVHCMQDFDFFDIEHKELVLIVTSTFGNGDPPENGEEFAKQLYALKLSHEGSSDVNLECHSIIKRMESVPASFTFGNESTHDAPLPLVNVRYAVFALGSSAYPNFCSFGKYINNLFHELGGERILRLVCGDELRGQEQTFNQWVCEIFQAACDTFCIDDPDLLNNATMDIQAHILNTEKIRLQKVQDADDTFSVLSRSCNRKVLPCEVISVSQLHPSDDGRETVCVRLNTFDHPDLKYQPGDHLGVFPKNRDEIVEGILSRLEDCPAHDQVVQVEKLKEYETSEGKTSKWEKYKRFPACTLRQILTSYLDITTPPSTKVLEVLSSYAENKEEQKQLTELAQNADAYEEWKSRSYPHLYDVLMEFPSAKPPASIFISCLQPLQPRFYSISSSLSMYPGETHLTVAIVTYETQGKAGSTHYGVCSNYLKSLSPGMTLPCFVRSASLFHMPQDTLKPIIMIGPGTGIAPFRSFWQHRSSLMRSTKGLSCGSMTLFFGCRKKIFHLYRDETAAMTKEGSLTNEYAVFSREPGVPKTYVQEKLKEMASFVYDTLFKYDGHIYVCGDCTMAEDVYQTIKNIIMSMKGCSSKQVEKILHGLRDERRYHEDIFGITLRTAEVQSKGRAAAKSNTDEQMNL